MADDQRWFLMDAQRVPQSTPGTVDAEDTGLLLQAVLFDMDGTLVDTEPYWVAAEYDLVESLGGTWSDEHAHAIVGNALLTSAEYIREHGGVDLPAPVIVERLIDDVAAAALRKMPWRPGALELVAQVKAHSIGCAMVTMSYARLAGTVTAQLPPGTFDAVVTGDELRHGKPDPEAYLTAAARLGADPARCVAIEDSPTGVASAEAAGCVVVAVPHLVAIGPAPGRTVVASLEELSVDRLEALVRERAVRTA
jgi:HAD superfamily hydrolase (TIGR01509 family)